MNSDAEPIEPHFTAAVNEHPILAITPRWQRYGIPAAVLSHRTCWARSRAIYSAREYVVQQGRSPASTRNPFATISRRPLGRPTTT